MMEVEGMMKGQTQASLIVSCSVTKVAPTEESQG
jgi:hypothetical protein